MSKLYIIRHGQTDYNIQNRYCGSTDISLNCTGVEQAKELVDVIRDYPIDYIFSSSMIRAQQTAEILNQELCIPCEVIDGIQERNIGVYEGLTREEVKEQHPECWNGQYTRIFDKAPGGGETIEQVQNRVYAALESLKSRYEGKNILVVTHGFVSKVINKYFHEVSESEFFQYSLKNCEIAEFEF